MTIYRASAYAQSTGALYSWYTLSADQPLGDYVVGVHGAAEKSDLAFPTLARLLPGEDGAMWERVTIDETPCLRVRRALGVDPQWQNINSSLGRAVVAHYTATESARWARAGEELTPKE